MCQQHRYLGEARRGLFAMNDNCWMCFSSKWDLSRLRMLRMLLNNFETEQLKLGQCHDQEVLRTSRSGHGEPSPYHGIFSESLLDPRPTWCRKSHFAV